MKKLLTLAILTMVGPWVSSAQAQTCNPPLPHINIPPVSYQRPATYYDDVLTRCSNDIYDLSRAASRANRIAGQGRLNEAANILVSALKAKEITIGPGGYDLPHTRYAIQYGSQLLQEVVDAAESERGRLPANLVAQIKYMTAAEVYKLIRRAYYDLDVNYFRQVHSSWCRGYSCNQQDPFGFLPQDYYQGVARLAQDFLQVQKSLSIAQGSDKIELHSIAATSFAAKSILLSSVFRRSFSCQITRLHDLEYDVRGYLQCSDGIPSWSFVDDIRAQFNSIHIPTWQCW